MREGHPLELINENAVNAGERLVGRRVRIKANDCPSFIHESVS